MTFASDLVQRRGVNAVSQLVGHLNNWIGPRTVMTTGTACMGVVGIGLGLNTAPVNGVAVATLPPERSGTASGIVNTSRMVGATLGGAVLGTILAAHAGENAAGGLGFRLGLHAAMTGSAVSELLGTVVRSR